MVECEFECRCVVCSCKVTVVQDSEPESKDFIGVVCEDCSENGLYENQQHFGDFMFRLRSEYGWSRDYVAKRLGFSSESSVMNFETGHTVMKPKHISRFCAITPNQLTVPVLFAMFEVSTVKAPCKCICHHDMGNDVPNIYDDEGRCRLCDHADGDCTIWHGLWFDNSRENYYSK